jgi:hypothetical protein
MTTYLIAQAESGKAICPAGVIENRHIPERRYPIVEHVVTLDGQPEPVLRHDWLALCSMPGGLYRLMTPGEQNAMRSKLEEQTMVEE